MRRMTRQQLTGLIQHLESGVKRLRWDMRGSLWSDYENLHTYTDAAIGQKALIIQDAIEFIKPEIVWDLGANIGKFSRLSSERGILTIAFDVDPGAVEINYQKLVKEGSMHLLPLIMDITNPSPNLGWRLEERRSFFGRGPADLALALALIHHLAIRNNIPFYDLAQFFSSICKWLLIEFVPKDDPQVRKIMGIRKDIFPHYTQNDFEKEFSSFFKIIKLEPIKDSSRIIYMMKKL